MSLTEDRHLDHQHASCEDPDAEAKLAFFDSMLMYGWLADREQRVYRVNKSLEDWMKSHRMLDLAAHLTGEGGGIPFRDFLSRILGAPGEDDAPDKRIGERIEAEVKTLAEKVESEEFARAMVAGQGRTQEVPGDEVESGEYFIQKNLQVVEADPASDEPATVLAAVRVVKAGAIRMNSENVRDRVDIITVCRVVRDGERWKVVGFQGQLQQAWIRVKAGIQAGTQAGTVGLMGRNMSHNIGSHALFYLERDEADKKKKRFYRYLRERMELLAGFSTAMPLSSTTTRLGKLVSAFKRNTALLDNIALSEEVRRVAVVLTGTDREVSLPAGVLGAQALYTILENNIRDSAKHGRSDESPQDSLTINIDAHEPEDPNYREDFIEVVVTDDRNNYDKAGAEIEKAIEGLRIVDELGRLEPGNWGIKERFIAAAILRGIRLENIAVVQQGNNRDSIIDLKIGRYRSKAEPPILGVRNMDGNLGWVFHLMKPKAVLFIGPSAAVKSLEYSAPHGSEEKVTLKDLEWFYANVERPSKIRHQFIVVQAEKQEDVEYLEAHADLLPYRVFVCPPDGAALPEDSPFAAIDKSSLTYEALSPAALYSEWVAWLIRRKGLEPPEPAGAAEGENAARPPRESPALPEAVFLSDGQLNILTPDDAAPRFRRELKELSYNPDRWIVLFDRHGMCKKPGRGGIVWDADLLAPKTLHYEPHESGDPTRQIHELATEVSLDGAGEGWDDPTLLGFACAEAALLKILIVDERLDPWCRSECYTTSGSNKWSCTYHELFGWRGIDIKGGEYGRKEALPGREKLVEWATRRDGEKYYDFMLLHKGIVDKLIKHSTTTSATDAQAKMRELFDELKKHVRHLIIHSGRMSMKDLPEGCKFMALSNVDSWLRNKYSKLHIVEDICLLRRV